MVKCDNGQRFDENYVSWIRNFTLPEMHILGSILDTAALHWQEYGTVAARYVFEYIFIHSLIKFELFRVIAVVLIAAGL